VSKKGRGIESGCIEEIAWRVGFIENEKLMENAAALSKSGYGNYPKGLKKDRF
jgi:glucose-1-phosphate thymidylyltransferase